MLRLSIIIKQCYNFPPILDAKIVKIIRALTLGLPSKQAKERPKNEADKKERPKLERNNPLF
jgi:hypothetical protein